MIDRRGFLVTLGAVAAGTFCEPVRKVFDLAGPRRATGETLFWLNNTKQGLFLHVSQDPTYAFGFTKLRPNGVPLAGQVRLCWTLENIS